jgi:PAS domain S-box-containing protein
MLTQPERSGAGACFPNQDGSDFVQLFNLSLDLLCIAGIDGFFRRVNPSWTRILGWSEAELLSRPVQDFMHPEDRERTLQARVGLAKGVLIRGLENRYVCKDGTYRSHPFPPMPNSFSPWRVTSRSSGKSITSALS